jgi:hypothetical protein
VSEAERVACFADWLYTNGGNPRIPDPTTQGAMRAMIIPVVIEA